MRDVRMELAHQVFRPTVVHLVPAMEQGGVETVVYDLNRALVRAGWRSVVVSRGGRLVERICADGGEHVALDLKSKNPLTALARAWKLRRVLRAVAGAGETKDAQDRGDAEDARDVRDARPRCLICAHSRVPAWLFVLARKLDSTIRPFSHSTIRQFGNSIIRPFDHSIISSLPFITYAHGANSVSRYSAVMTKGDRVITPSQFLADYLVANYAEKDAQDRQDERDTGGLRAKIRVIHPAVDFGRFDPAKLDAGVVADLRRAWGLAAGDRVVMAVGRLTPLKGFDHLIRDLAGRPDVTPDAGWGDVLRGPQAKLVIVGGADRRHLAYAAELKALSASLGVADRVVFAGPQVRIPECLSLADVVVSGNVTKPESFGLSVAEALAMNRPVRLLRRFGGAAEILDAVAAANRPTRREGVRALCDFDIMSQKTQTVYKELVK